MTTQELIKDILAPAGWGGLIGKILFDWFASKEDRKKAAAEAEGVHVDSDIKMHTAWQAAYQDLAKAFQVLNAKLLDIETKSIEQARTIEQLTNRSERLQEEVTTLKNEVETWEGKYSSLEADYNKLLAGEK